MRIICNISFPWHTEAPPCVHSNKNNGTCIGQNGAPWYNTIISIRSEMASFTCFSEEGTNPAQTWVLCGLQGLTQGRVIHRGALYNALLNIYVTTAARQPLSWLISKWNNNNLGKVYYQTYEYLYHSSSLAQFGFHLTLKERRQEKKGCL